MERAMSPEERLRRAEEIYYKRKAQGVRVSTGNVSIGKSNKISLGKRMAIQIAVCVVIYMMMWLIKGYNNVFSENFINQTKNILNYDMNFQKLYNQCVEYFNNNFNSIIKMDENTGNSDNNNIEQLESQGLEENNESVDKQNLTEETVENTTDAQLENSPQTSVDSTDGMDTNSSQGSIYDGTLKAKEDSENINQMQEDASYVKTNYSLIHPIEGTITSRFGGREETEIISAFHQGIDIAGPEGTAIHASMEGTVVAASYAGDYGNHIKIQNNDVLTVYAHCSQLEVKEGDYSQQGQEIGKVGATGKVTGPHLHFEVRRDGRYINPELIMDF